MKKLKTFHISNRDAIKQKTKKNKNKKRVRKTNEKAKKFKL